MKVPSSTGEVADPAVSRLADDANDPQRRFWAVADARDRTAQRPRPLEGAPPVPASDPLARAAAVHQP